MLFQFLRGGFEGYTPKEIVFQILLMFFALAISFSVHEFMHAYVALKLGDPTAKNLGRVTLNPAAHVDPIGATLLILFGFGWGRPVPYNPGRLDRFKSKRAMCIMVSLAGVTGNFILAFIAGIISAISGGLFVKLGFNNVALISLFSIFEYIQAFSLGLLAFNLIPIPPLDGFQVLEELLPYKTKYSDGYRNFMSVAPRILLALVFLSSIVGIPLISIVMEVIEFPFALIINLVKALIEMLIIML